MSEEKKSESAIPSDDFTMTDGFNYGLDGFHFDMETGEGVRDGARLPSVKGVSGLPDGIVRTTEAAFEVDESSVQDADGLGDLESFMKEGSLAELGWLHGAEQDPDRLPKNPVDRGIMELEQAWGSGLGRAFHLVPNLDKEVVDAKSKSEETSGKTASIPTEELIRVTKRAMRKSAFGEPLKDILEDIVQSLGHEAYRVKSAVAQIRKEHGLAGKVFIRASSFPGLHNGKWKDEIRRKCPTARYVVADNDIYGDILKMSTVSQVPWSEALKWYAPRLKAAGHSVSSDGSPMEILKTAFASPAKAVSSPTNQLPVSIAPSQRVSAKDAAKEWATLTDEREIVDISGREEKKLWDATQLKVAKWVRSGLLNKEDGVRLVKSSADPRTVLKVASELISANRTSNYSGTGVGAGVARTDVSREAAWKLLRESELDSNRKAVEIEISRSKKAQSKIYSMVEAGLLMSSEADKILSSGKSASEMIALASAVAGKNRKFANVPMTPTETEDYKGPKFEVSAGSRPGFKQLTEQQTRVLEASSNSGIPANEFFKLIKWARIQMSEGLCGEELTQMIRLKFNGPLIKAASSVLSELRSEHEGLSGQLYVDSEAYASPSGTSGCEQGSLRHRTNQIRHVLAMPRCGSCVFKNANGTCQKYNKELVDVVPVADPKAYQKEALRLAQASDAEVTASLFASSYDSNEFSLGNDNLDNFDFDSSASNEHIGQVLFGGFEVGDE
jgi:hypothetical protein